MDAWGPEASPAIYSEEFHERALSRLAPWGRTWAKLGNIGLLDDPSVQKIYDAVRCTYPYAMATGGDPGNPPTGLFGSQQPVRIPLYARILDTTAGGCDPLSILHPHRLKYRAGETRQQSGHLGGPPGGR